MSPIALSDQRTLSGSGIHWRAAIMLPLPGLLVDAALARNRCDSERSAAPILSSPFSIGEAIRPWCRPLACWTRVAGGLCLQHFPSSASASALRAKRSWLHYSGFQTPRPSLAEVGASSSVFLISAICLSSIAPIDFGDFCPSMNRIRSAFPTATIRVGVQSECAWLPPPSAKIVK